MIVPDYDVQCTPCLDNGQAETILRSHIDDRDDSVAVEVATFEKPVFDVVKFRKDMQSSEFMERLLNRVRTGDWKTCTEKEKSLMIVSNAVTIQND